jgi:hypothetical protein
LLALGVKYWYWNLTWVGGMAIIVSAFGWTAERAKQKQIPFGDDN